MSGRSFVNVPLEDLTPGRLAETAALIERILEDDEMPEHMVTVNDEEKMRAMLLRHLSGPNFALNIHLGNAEMQTTGHVAAALRDVADRLEAGSFAGHIRDVNGNRVGSWDSHLTGEGRE